MKQIKDIIRECLREAVGDAPKKGERFRVNGDLTPEKMIRFLTNKFGGSYKYDRLSNEVVCSAEGKKEKKKISKPDGMPIEQWQSSVVFGMHPEMEDLPGEEWREISNEGDRYFGGNASFSHYEVSNFGRVRLTNLEDAEKSGIVKSYPAPTRGGNEIHLSYGKMKTCPRLDYIVANAFVPKPNGADPKKLFVKHKNDDNFDDRAENLEWVVREKKQRMAEGHHNLMFERKLDEAIDRAIKKILK